MIKMDYHVMAGTKSGNIVTYTVAFHIPVPDAENAVGVNYRTIIATYMNTESAVPDISEAEQEKLDTGELYEDVISLQTHIDGSGYLTMLEDWYNGRVALISAEFADCFKFSGLAADF